MSEFNPTDLPLFAQPPESAPSARPGARSLAGPLGGSGARTVPARPGVPPLAQAPTSAASTALLDTAETIDHSAVSDLQTRVIDSFKENDVHRLSTALTQERHGEMIDGLIRSHMADLKNERLQQGKVAPRAAEEKALAQGVRDAIFGAGPRLQPLLELEGIENIEANGCDDVWLEFADGRIERGPVLADSDEQLITELQRLARFSGSGEKDFSIATKKLRMSLADGSRLAAHAWLTPRPSVAIRKHRYIDTDLDESKRLGAVDEGLRSFLHAAVRAGKKTVVVGPPAAGKTTLLRAMCNAMDPMKRVATIEAMYELGLHGLPHRHRRVFPTEAQGGGEPGDNGARVGEHTLSDLLDSGLQMNVDYFIVGEILTGAEIMAMIRAMQSGKGCMATLHATSALNAVDRMKTLITGASPTNSPQFAAELLSQNLDLIVYIDVIDERDLGGRRHRHVSEVLSLSPNSDSETDPVEREHLWKPGPDGRAVPTGRRPSWIHDLVRHGFDLAHLEVGAEQWGAPLPLKVPLNGGQR